MTPERQILISIVVPCYKAEAVLPDCIDSLLAQDMDGYEVVCVNDGSPDHCLDIMRRYESEHPGLVRAVDRENGGPWDARWSGIDAARGEYVTFLDSDDTATPDFARSLYEAASAQDADLVICGFNRTDQASGHVLSTEMCIARTSFLAAHDPGRIIEINPAPWNKAYRASVLHKVRQPHEMPVVMEDLALLLLAIPEMTKPVVFVPRPLVHYMVHAGSLMNTIKPSEIASTRRMLLEVRGRYLEPDVPEGLRDALDAVVFLHLGISMSLRCSETGSSLLRAHLQETTRYLDEHFPTWRHSPFISLRYARAQEGSSYTKLLIAQRVYRAHLMRPFLACYRLLTRLAGSDVKW